MHLNSISQAILLAFAGSGIAFSVQAQTVGATGTAGTNFCNGAGGSCSGGWGYHPPSAVGGTGGDGLTAAGVQSNSGTITGGAGGAGGNNTTASNVYADGPPGAPGGIGGAGVSGTGFTLTNSGSITGGAGGTGGTGAGGTVNTGWSGMGGAAGVGVTGSAYTLVNAGSISGGTGGTGGGPGAGAVALISTGNADITSSGTITGTGGSDAINLSGGGNRLILNAGSTTTGNVVTTSGTGNGGDRITLADTATINGSLSALAGTAVTAGSANISGAYTSGGSLKVNAGKTLAVSGNFANTGGMTTVVTGMNSYGKVSATGTAAIDGSLFVDAAGARGLNNGSLAGIVSGSSLTGTFSSVSTNSLLFSFVPVYQANQVDLSITALTPKVLDTTTALGNTPATGAAAALDKIFAGDPGGAIAGKFLAFTSGQEQQLSGAVSQTLPVLVGGSILATRSAMVDVNRIINDRFRVAKGLASGNDYSRGSNVWLQPFGSWADQSSRGAVAGYKSDTQGIGAGFDKAISPSFFLGAGFAYANSDVDGKSSVAPSRLDIDMYQLIGYGTYSLDHRTDINFQLDAGKNRNESSRDILFASTTASGRYDTKSAHIGLGFNRVYPLSAKTSITPSLRADYTWIKDSSYTESGADALNLQVESRSAEALVLTLGGKVAHWVNERLGFDLNLGAGYDTLHERASITTAFAGSPDLAFTTYGINPEPWIATAGVGAVYQLRNGPEISARYAAEQREGFFNQTASLKARWAF